MKAMRFTFPQLNVSIFQLDKGMDVMICLNERQVIVENPEGISETMYEYDGNIFRTHSLTAEQIKADPESYLDYEGDEAPTDAMVEYANLKIDEYTAQLMEEGLI
mgnify:CR=1 FL=1